VTRRALVGSLLGLWLAACATAQRREDVLDEHARLFNDDLRWGRWEQVAGAMPRDEGEAFLARAQGLEAELVMADFNVSSITFHDGGNAATVVAKFEWYLKRDPVVRNTTIEEAWQWQGGRWVMNKLRRTRGDRFGLVTEPVAPVKAD
jgi:hypothetical protein